MTQTFHQEQRGSHRPSFTPILSGNYAQDFAQAMHRAGLNFNGNIVGDGNIHRFSSDSKGNKNCWYVCFGLAGAFGDWSRDINEKWSFGSDHLSDRDKEKRRDQMAQSQRVADEARLQNQEETAALALDKWTALSETGQSAYLTRKQVEGFGVRYNKEFLIIPIRDISGKLWSLQWIKPDGTKRFLSGGRKKGCFHHSGDLKDGSTIIIVEGYATGASLHVATGHSTVIAFDAGNLGPVIEELKQAYPKSPLLIAADDDCWKDYNTGREKAEAAAQKYGCAVVFPQFTNTATKPTDFNDLHVLEGLDKVKTQIEEVIKQFEWPELKPLYAIKSPLPPVIPLPPELIPEPYQDWLCDIAERMQCPLDYVAIGALIVTASLVGAGCEIRPKRLDSWKITPNLWGGIVGAPSTLKSPALKEIMRPIELLEKEAFEAYEKDMRTYNVNLEAFKATKEVIKKEMGKAAIDADHFAMEHAKQRMHNLQEPELPHCKRYLTNDATIEKMHELLSRNGRGLLLFRDELMGLLVDWDRQGHEGDRAFYLEAWNGYGSKTTDRIGRGTIHTKNLCISILGSTQPTKLLSYFQKTLGGAENDGLLQRFQLLVYPDELKTWRFVDRKPNDHAREQTTRIMVKLAKLDLVQYGAMLDDAHETPYFHFDPQAQETFIEWLSELEQRLRDNNDEPILTEHLTKYRKLMPSLALIFHLINVASGKASGPVTLECAERAAAWCDYLESHARRIYGCGLDESYQAARNLAKRIQNGELRAPFDLRDIYRKQWTFLKTKEEADITCHLLSDAGWIKEQQIIAGGKVKTIYLTNPKIP